MVSTVHAQASAHLTGEDDHDAWWLVDGHLFPAWEAMSAMIDEFFGVGVAADDANHAAPCAMEPDHGVPPDMDLSDSDGRAEVQRYFRAKEAKNGRANRENQNSRSNKHSEKPSVGIRKKLHRGQRKGFRVCGTLLNKSTGSYCRLKLGHVGNCRD